MSKILITGGAGFIGLNLSVELIGLGYDVVIIDDLKNSYKTHINGLIKIFGDKIKFYKQDIRDYNLLKQIALKENVDKVMHLAAKKYIAESFKKPKQYFDNNMQSLDCVLKLCSELNINKLMFASSITVYGNPIRLPIKEEDELKPISPYAETKMLGEKVILEWSQHNPSCCVYIYRFTNPVGANTNYMLGDHPKYLDKPLVPYLIECAVDNKPIVLNGNSYPTRDGTPIRDYIHVSDLAKIVANSFTQKINSNYNVYNVGCGENGYTVLEIVSAVSKAAQKPLNYTFGPERKGDIYKLVADNLKITNAFGVKPTKDIFDMVKSQIDFDNFIKK